MNKNDIKCLACHATLLSQNSCRLTSVSITIHNYAGTAFEPVSDVWMCYDMDEFQNCNFSKPIDMEVMLNSNNENASKNAANIHWNEVLLHLHSFYATLKKSMKEEVLSVSKNDELWNLRYLTCGGPPLKMSSSDFSSMQFSSIFGKSSPCEVCIVGISLFHGADHQISCVVANRVEM